MKKSVLTGAVSILMAAALAFGAPAALAAEGDSESPSVSGPLDLAAKNTLTVQLENKNYDADLDPTPATPPEGGGTAPEEPEEPSKDEYRAPAVVDLYLVAKAVKLPGSDGYSYEKTENFEALELAASGESFTAEDWQKIALQAAKLVFPDTAKEAPAITPVKEAQPLGDIPELDAGLYLIVPHGKGLTPEQYVEYPPAETPEAETVVTKAFSELYDYRFTPYLVSLPGRNVTSENGDTTGGSTDDEFGWSYRVTSNLKVDREPRYGQLTIVKGIDAYRDGEPVTFVFEVKAYEGEGETAETVYRNVVGVTFNGDGTTSQEVELDRIPAGSTVTVREIYSGATYTAAAESVGDLVISATEIVQAEFSNIHNDRNGGGYGANNHYEYSVGDGAAGWDYMAPEEGGADE